LVGDIFEDESANVCGGTLGTKGTARAVPFDYVIPEFRAMREYSHACCLFALVFVVFLSHEILPRGVIHVMVFFFGEKFYAQKLAQHSNQDQCDDSSTYE
jgi:hypothetical protein